MLGPWSPDRQDQRNWGSDSVSLLSFSRDFALFVILRSAATKNLSYPIAHGRDSSLRYAPFSNDIPVALFVKLNYYQNRTFCAW